MATENVFNSVPLSTSAQRLGRNLGRYLGETIQIQSTLNQIQTLALKHGWRSDCFLRDADWCLIGYQLPAQHPRKRLYLSAGIHGDEPAGPLAVLELLRENNWPEDLEVWICPCLNPSGFFSNTRENAKGLDLNRQYREPRAQETRAHMEWLQRQPRFDVTLCLHEDWEAHGFYVYELDVEQRYAFGEEIVRRVAEVCPLDRSPLIEGREARDGIIRPNADVTLRPDWPEAFYLIQHKTAVSCTLEAPSDFPLDTRVRALVVGVRAVLDLMKSDA